MSDEEGPSIEYLCMMVGIAIMHDVRMVVREELKRVGLTKKEDEQNE